MSGNSIINNALIVFILKLTVLTLTLTVHFYLARTLNLTEFGLYSLSVTCLLFSITIAKLGLEQGIIRLFSSESKSTINSLYNTLICYVLIGTVSVATILISFDSFIAQDIFNKSQLSELIVYIALITISQTYVVIHGAILRAKKIPVFGDMLGSGLTPFLLLLSLLFYPPNSSVSVLQYYLIASLISCVISIVYTSKRLSFSYVSNVNHSGFTKLITTTKSMLIISIAALITQRFSLLILGRYVPLEELAIFGLAIKVSLLFGYPLIAINTVTAPKYARLYKKGNIKVFKQLALFTNKILIIVASVIIFFVYLFIDEFIYFINPSYMAAVGIIKILAIGQWFNLATGSVVSMLIMAGFERLHRKNTLIIVSINLIAILLVIPEYGVMGAAWVTSIAISAKNLVALYYVNKLIYTKC